MLITIETGMEGWEMAGSLRKTVPCTGECLQCRFQLYPNVLRACSTFLGRGFEVHPCRKFPFYLMFVLHTRKMRINNIMLNLLRCEWLEIFLWESAIEKEPNHEINFAAYLVRHIFISVYFSFSTDSRRLFPELIFITELVTIVGIIIDTIFALLSDV